MAELPKVVVPLLVIVDVSAVELPKKFKLLPVEFRMVALPASLLSRNVMLLPAVKFWMVALPALLVSVKMILPPPPAGFSF